MIRNSLIFLSSAVLMVACSQSKSEDITEKPSDTDASPVETLLQEVPAPAVEAEPAMELPALPEVVATIDGTEKILGAELQKMVDAQLKRFVAMGLGGPQLAEFTNNARQGILEQLVMRTLLLREAAAQGFSVTDEELKDFFEKNLPPTMTLDMIAQQQGVTVEDIRNDVKTGLTINKLAEKQFEGLTPMTDDELKAEYDKIAAQNPKAFETEEEVEASHILVKVDAGADEAAKAAAREKIEGLRKQLVEGADFAALAAENSDCPSGKQNGGNLGSFGRGRMVKPFEDAAFAQPLNEIGPVVETDFGFHVIKVTKKTAAGTQTFDEVKDDIRKFAEDQRKNALFQTFSSGLLDKAKVETFLPKIELPEPAPEAAPEETRPLPAWAQ